jgi:uncharacterized membrane protein YtjA (UPF0391 family)
MEATIAAVAVALIAGLFGFGGAKFARRKEKADAAQVVVETALSLLNPLKVEIGVLGARLTVVESENVRLVTSVAKLEIDNRNLRSENSGLRTRVTLLEAQLLGLGHMPANAAGFGGPTTTTTSTETTVVTEHHEGDAA